MADNRFFLVLITIIIPLISAAQPPVSSPLPSQSPPSDQIEDDNNQDDNNQFNHIIDALIGAGDFAGWASILSSTDPSALPLTATFFIPTNDAVSNLSSSSITAIDPFLIPYHIVPQRLTFSDLRRFSTRTRLPTLLPSKYVVVTSNATANFTVDGSRIMHPDIFLNSAFAVHGIESVMNYSDFGSGGDGLVLNSTQGVNATRSNHRPPRIRSPPAPKRKRREPEFPGEATTCGPSSDALCVCSEFLMIASIGFAVLVFKIV